MRARASQPGAISMGTAIGAVTGAVLAAALAVVATLILARHAGATFSPASLPRTLVQLGRTAIAGAVVGASVGAAASGQGVSGLLGLIGR